MSDVPLPPCIEPVPEGIEVGMAVDLIRKSCGVSQIDQAKKLGLSQAAVSKFEYRTDAYMSTLEAYVGALGGRLEIEAVFPDSRVPLRLGKLRTANETGVAQKRTPDGQNK